jgi:hypothetical protein
MTSPTTPKASTKEVIFSSSSGYLPLLVGLSLPIGAFAWIAHTGDDPSGDMVLALLGLVLLAVFAFAGLYVLQPNQAALLTFFGDYRGTDRATGLRWAIPFYGKKKLSLRARNLVSERLKVNDKRGNPIEIAAAIVWRVEDTARAAYDVEDFERYVTVQAEAAVRHLAGQYAYDHSAGADHETDEITADRATWIGSGWTKIGIDPRDTEVFNLAQNGDCHALDEIREVRSWILRNRGAHCRNPSFG